MPQNVVTGKTLPPDPVLGALLANLVRYAEEMGFIVPLIQLRYVDGLIVDREACAGYCLSAAGRRRSTIWIDATRSGQNETLAHELAHAICNGCTTQDYDEHGSVFAVIESVIQRQRERLGL